MDPNHPTSTEQGELKNIISALPIPEPTEDFEDRLKTLSMAAIKSHRPRAPLRSELQRIFQVLNLKRHPLFLAVNLSLVALCFVYFYTLPPSDDIRATDLISELSLATI